MINLKKVVLIILLCHLVFPLAAGEHKENVLAEMFSWWNEAMKDPESLTEEAFRRFYTEDAAIRINTVERVRGVKNMVPHFKAIQKKLDFIEIVLPFEESFASENRIFTYHLIHRRVDGVDGTSHLMGYAVIEDGKIALVDLISFQQATDVKKQ